jgi:hypothetical protein
VCSSDISLGGGTVEPDDGGGWSQRSRGRVGVLFEKRPLILSRMLALISTDAAER